MRLCAALLLATMVSPAAWATTGGDSGSGTTTTSDDGGGGDTDTDSDTDSDTDTDSDADTDDDGGGKGGGGGDDDDDDDTGGSDAGLFNCASVPALDLSAGLVFAAALAVARRRRTA